jgi:hypothetical protein
LISANATCSILYGKRAKAAQLDAILPGHRSNDFIEYNVYGFFHHTVGEMKELTCYVERQLRFDHAGIPQDLNASTKLILPDDY